MVKNVPADRLADPEPTVRPHLYYHNKRIIDASLHTSGHRRGSAMPAHVAVGQSNTVQLIYDITIVQIKIVFGPGSGEDSKCRIIAAGSCGISKSQILVLPLKAQFHYLPCE